MSDTKEKVTYEDLTTSDYVEPEAGHDAWVREQVKRALDEKAKGATYTDFRDVAAEYDFDAR